MIPLPSNMYVDRLMAELSMTQRRSAPSTLTLVLLTGLAAMAISIFLPSLPHMAEYYGVEYPIIQVSISGYIALTAVVQLLAGPLSDRYGRRPVVLGAIVAFSLATVGCLLSENIWLFMLFRMLQAVIVTVSIVARTVVRDVDSGPQATRRLSYIMMGMSLVPMISPTLGGFLSELFDWHAVFLLLLAFAMIVGVLAYFDMGETAQQINPFPKTRNQGFRVLIKDKHFISNTLISMLSNGAFLIFLSAGPLIATQHYGLSPSTFGLYFALTPAGYLLGNYLTSRLSHTYCSKTLIKVGSVIAVLGLASIIFVVNCGADMPSVFFGLMLFVGLGNGLIIPNATVRMLNVTPALIGSASGLGGAIMTAGGALLSLSSDIAVYPDSGILPITSVLLVCFIGVPFILSMQD
ncbi:Bcr/CflA family drug resistance efflux transporter [Vibrio inusitatus NBRC 102082]|uniref:Bcr/CflA family efflux transporter n=1 Tax=Vibrio inusitatus NBRC 102082 TaxID=1219070 RepID=A0A4Y3HS76_9VIBR|nr:multidrug effflux MFS transporter [Vibrio inusitatus]GEA49865.1 Bcr/CflA family drug resistance efflux transporter [Vibrio inusitatus NBRC 102082]